MSAASEGQSDDPFKMEGQLHKLQTICTIIDHLVDILLAPSNGWRDGGQLVFRLDEADINALAWQRSKRSILVGGSMTTIRSRRQKPPDNPPGWLRLAGHVDAR